MKYFRKYARSTISLLCACILLGGTFGVASGFGQQQQQQCQTPEVDTEGNASGGVPVSIPGQGPGKANSCDPEVTVYVQYGITAIHIDFPCGGGSAEIQFNTAAERQDISNYLGDECGAPWVQQYFPGLPPPTSSSSPSLPRTAATSSLPSSGQGSQHVVLADFNGDGSPDSASIGSQGIVVHLMSSTGSVISSNTYPVGFSTSNLLASNIVAADFNGDGKMDLAVSNYGNPGTSPGGIAILLGNGDGTFAAPIAVSAGLNPLSMAAADFNSDGKLDIAVANQSSAASNEIYPGPGAISVLFGNGNGTFAAPATYPTGEDRIGLPDSLIALDLNGDGVPDLAVANRNDNSVSTWINAGGTFKAPLVTPVPAGVEYLAFADFNHDGKMDVVATSNLDNALVMLTGNGDGSFRTPAAYAVGNQPASAGVMALGDGNTLVFTVDSITTATWTTMISSQGIVGSPPLNFVGGFPIGVAAADLNGDGQPDAVVAGGASDITVLMSNNGVLQSPVGYSLGASGPPAAVAIGDMNGDGKPDVVTANSDGSVSVLLGGGNGQLGSATTTAANTNPLGMALADFNGDGKLDVAVASYGSNTANSTDGGVVVLRGNGDGTFQSPSTLSANGLHAQAAAASDLNGDGIPDIAAIMVGSPGQPATLAVFLGQTGGTFQAARTMTLKTTGGAQGGVAIGDFNGDGKPDIAAFGNYNGQIDVLLGDGTGAFHEAATTPVTTSANAAALALADVNGDGVLDIITTGSFLLGNGDGTFQPEQQFLAAAYTTAIAPVKSSASVGIFSVGQAKTLVATWLIQPAARALTITSDVSAANFTLATIAPSSIATVFGADLATGTADFSGAPPTSLGGATVNIVDSAGVSRPAPIFYASPTQINYEVPAATAIGNASVMISAGGLSGSFTTPVAAIAPGIFALDTSGLVAAIVVDVAPSGAQSFANVYQVAANNSVAPLPVDLSAGQVYLEIYGTGIRSAANVAVTVGGVSVPVLSFGAQGIDPGLDQINIGPLPQNLQGKGQVNVTVTANGQPANVTNITFK